MVAAMSTDALREALELKIDELLDDFVAELDRKTFEDYAQKRNTYSSRIAALAAPASETEKLPAKWRPDPEALYRCPYCNIDCRLKDLNVVVDSYLNVCHYYCLNQERAALKADRQGG
jgi:hypothetical protein